MIDAKSSNKNCPTCGGELRVTSANYFGNTGIIILAILGGILSVAFCHTVITTSQGGNWGKVVVFGTIAIFTLVFKISKRQRDILSCANCELKNTTNNAQS